jgi:hypothetical protein
MNTHLSKLPISLQPAVVGVAHLRALLPHLGLPHRLVNCCRLLRCAIQRLLLLLLGRSAGLAWRLG